MVKIISFMCILPQLKKSHSKCYNNLLPGNLQIKSPSAEIRGFFLNSNFEMEKNMLSVCGGPERN